MIFKLQRNDRRYRYLHCISSSYLSPSHSPSFSLSPSPLLPLSHSIHLSHSLYPSLSLSHTLFLISLGYLLTSKYLAKFVWYLKRDWERLPSNIFQSLFFKFIYLQEACFWESVPFSNWVFKLVDIFSEKSFAQAWTIILLELSIDFLGISLLD